MFFHGNILEVDHKVAMAKLEILEFPDPKLRTKAAPVTVFDEALLRLIDDMFETMYEAPGIGLAATQINVHKRLIVIDLSEDRSDPLVVINPSIEVTDINLETHEEGCLSVPGFFEAVSRPCGIILNAQNPYGESFSLEPSGLLAVCIQHEMDHLDGKLFVDYLSTIKRQRIRSKLVKQRKSKVSSV